MADEQPIIDAIHMQPVPPTWCVLECPECSESWAIDTLDFTPQLFVMDADAIFRECVMPHECRTGGVR